SCGRTWCSGSLLFLLKTGAAQDRPVLRGLEGNSCLFAAFGAGGSGLGAHTGSGAALGFALFATLGIVAKLLIVEEDLFACGEDKLRAAIHANQDSIVKYHGRSPKMGRS